MQASERDFRHGECTHDGPAEWPQESAQVVPFVSAISFFPASPSANGDVEGSIGMAAIPAADAPSSRRIVAGPTMISARETALTVGGSGAGASTTMAPNSFGSFRLRQNQLALTRQGAPGQEVVRLHPATFRHFRSPSRPDASSPTRFALELVRPLAVGVWFASS